MSDAPAGQLSTDLIRDEVDRDLGLIAVVLGVLAALAVGTWLLFTRAQPMDGAWPYGTPLTDISVLTLSADEAGEFDATVFGAPGGVDAMVLNGLRLPPKMPTLATALWAPASNSVLNQAEARAAVTSLAGCSHTDCDLEARKADLGPVRTIGRSGPVDGTSCAADARETEREKRVPNGLLAITLGWVPECHDQAVLQFRRYARILRGGGSLEERQKTLGLLYARFAIAKLEDRGGGGHTEFLEEMRQIRQELLRDPEFVEAFRKLEDLPHWGLSTAEVQAEWLMAEAQELARISRGPRLASRLRDKDLGLADTTELRIGANPTLGQDRLRTVWCALSMRADLPHGMSERCLRTLAASRLLSEPLKCSVLARSAAMNGSWGRMQDARCPAESSQRMLMRYAASNQVWVSTLVRYGEARITDEERRQLRAYLAAYAAPSGNSRGWLAYERPVLHAALLVGSALLVLGVVWWLWAWFVRRPTLHRFLPPRLESDGIGGT